MDILSLLVGFVVGTFTGAAGRYFGEKYTDQRRSKEFAASIDRKWAELEKRFPNVIAEMKEDVKKPEFSSVRKFFVKSSRTIVNLSENSFEYHTDVHSELTAAIAHLEELGYIVDITPGNCPMYRMTEQFVDKLRNT
jgi:hypothetical protein